MDGPPRQILITSDSHSAGDFRGGIYNPGATLQSDGTVLLVARNERFTELERQRGADWMGSCRPLAIGLTPDGRVATCTPLGLDKERSTGRTEDFRLFAYAGGTWMSYTRVHSAGRIVQEVAQVHPTHVGPPVCPVLDFAQQPAEKNWLFFERPDGLYLLYAARPFRLLRLVDREAFRFETVMNTDIADEPIWRGVQQISWSAGPVEFDKRHLLVFVHWRDRSNNYLHYGMLVDRRTYLPVALARKPLFGGGTAAGVHPHVVYLTAVLWHQRGYHMFLGEGDTHVAKAQCTRAEMVAYMADAVQLRCTSTRQVPSPLQAITDPRGVVPGEIAGWYTYEHRGSFTRRVELMVDGSINGGHAHDATWTATTEGGVPVELQILDSDGQVSCRMRQDDAGGWSGTWGWGSQPVAQLRRDP